MKIKNSIKKLKDKIILIEDKFWDKLWGIEGYKDLPDTTPKQFNKWLNNHLGKGLQNCGEMYTLDLGDGGGVPKVGKDHLFFGEYKDADEKRRRLQGSNTKQIHVTKVQVYLKRV